MVSGRRRQLEGVRWGAKIDRPSVARAQVDLRADSLRAGASCSRDAQPNSSDAGCGERKRSSLAGPVDQAWWPARATLPCPVGLSEAPAPRERQV